MNNIVAVKVHESTKNLLLQIGGKYSFNLSQTALHLLHLGLHSYLNTNPRKIHIYSYNELNALNYEDPRNNIEEIQDLQEDEYCEEEPTVETKVDTPNKTEDEILASLGLPPRYRPPEKPVQLAETPELKIRAIKLVDEISNTVMSNPDDYEFAFEWLYEKYTTEDPDVLNYFFNLPAGEDEEYDRYLFRNYAKLIHDNVKNDVKSLIAGRYFTGRDFSNKIF